MSFLSPRETVASAGLLLYLVGFLAGMFMSSITTVVTTLLSLFVLGQVVFLIPCAMALVYPQLPNTRHLLHPESFFLIGLNILLVAPQGFMLPVYGDFVGMFVSLSALGAFIVIISFYFVDIFRVSKDSIIDIEYYQSREGSGVSQFWRFVQLPKSLKHGELLRLYVLVGVCLGIVGTHVYAFVSLRGGGACIILSTALVWISLYAGRTNWFARRAGQSKGFDTSRYGALN